MNTIYLSKTIILTNIIRTKEKCLIYYQNLSFNTNDKVTIIVNIIKTSTKIKVSAWFEVWTWKPGQPLQSGVSFSLSLKDPCAGKVIKANYFSKSWEVAPGWGASVTLFEEGPFWISCSLPCSCWPVEGGCKDWASLTGWGAGGATSFWLGICKARGKTMFSGFLSSEEALIPAWLRASSQIWVQ